MQKCLSINIFSARGGGSSRPGRSETASERTGVDTASGRGAEEEKNWLAIKGRLAFTFLPARHHAKSTQESIEAYMPPSAEAKRSSPF